MFPRNLTHTRHNPIVQTVRHALSLGERRSFYAPTTWGGLDGDTRPAIHVPAHLVEDEPQAIQWQDVEEVWFPGDHSDVGGGHPETAGRCFIALDDQRGARSGTACGRLRYSKIVPKIEKLSPCDAR
jgi:uncharacterized protein (DUF2235 family)